MTTTAAPDRRAALKARHRDAILTAARDLVAERGGPRFGVDELAERADVARRTVFNHFVSLDEVLLTLCGDALDVIVDDFIAAVEAAPLGAGDRATMFDEIAASLRNADVPAAIARICTILGESGPDDPRARVLTDQAFGRVAGKLLDEVGRRNPGADPLDAELLVGSLMNGVLVIAQHWILRTDARLDAESLAEWQRLLDRLVVSVRSGYMPESGKTAPGTTH